MNGRFKISAYCWWNIFRSACLSKYEISIRYKNRIDMIINGLQSRSSNQLIQLGSRYMHYECSSKVFSHETIQKRSNRFKFISWKWSEKFGFQLFVYLFIISTYDLHCNYSSLDSLCYYQSLQTYKFQNSCGTRNPLSFTTITTIRSITLAKYKVGVEREGNFF